MDDILHSLAGLQVRVSSVCCSVLEGKGDRCVVDAFSGFPFYPTYPPLAKRVCGLAVRVRLRGHALTPATWWRRCGLQRRRSYSSVSNPTARVLQL